jgi:hypothetical protein
VALAPTRTREQRPRDRAAQYCALPCGAFRSRGGAGSLRAARGSCSRACRNASPVPELGVGEQAAKIAEIDGQLSQKEAERDTITGTIAKLTETIPLLQQRVDTHKYLYERQLTSKITYLTELQDLVGQQHDLEINKVRYRQADAVLAALRDTRKKAKRNIAVPCLISLRRRSRRRLPSFRR